MGARWTPGTLHSQRLGVAATTDRLMETKLIGLGYVMVPRPDCNGAEVGGVGQDVMDLFSSRAVAITGELKRLAARIRGQPRRPAEQAHAVVAAPAGRAEHPPHQERRRRTWPGRPAATNPPTPSGSPRGKPRPPTGKSRHCRRYTGR